MKALYLEPDEEITSVIDRLKEIDDPDVAIVIPKRAGLLQSIVNLKLLRFQAEQLKKRISVVTTDKTGRNLASAVGLTVHQKLPESGGKVKEAVVKETVGSEIPITFRKRASKIIGKPSETDAPEIGYKPGGKGVVKRSIEQLREIAPLGGKSSAQADKPVRSIPVQAADTSKVPATQSRFLPKVSLPGIKSPKALEQDSVKKAPAAKPWTSLLKRWGWKLVIPVVVVLLGAGTAAAIVLPEAHITVTPKTDPLNVDVPLTLSAKAPGVDAAANVLPAKVIEVTRSGSRQVKATGQSAGGEKARGDITVVNTLSKNQPLVTKTRFQSPDGRVFRAQSSIVVPAGGQTTVAVIADDGGEAGNLPAGTKLTIPGLGGGDSVSGKVDTPLTGGTSSATSEISKSDVDRAKTELAEQVAREGLDEAHGKLAVGYKLDEHVVAATVLSADTAPPVGTPASTFTITGRVRISYFTYQEDELKKMINEDLQKQLPAGTELVDERTQAFTVTQTSADQIVGAMKISTFAAAGVSKDQVTETIKGKRSAEAATALKAGGKVSDIRIKLSPFWVMHIPKDGRKVHIHFQTGSAAIKPSPVPSTLPTPSALPKP